MFLIKWTSLGEDSFRVYVKQTLDITYEEFLNDNNTYFNKRHSDLFNTFIYDILMKNKILCQVNCTIMFFDNNKKKTFSDGNIDFASSRREYYKDALGRYKTLNFSGQCKLKTGNTQVLMEDIRAFLSTISNRPDEYGFLVSNNIASENTLTLLSNTALNKHVFGNKKIEHLEVTNEKLKKRIREFRR
ncbi:16415_t:CDS:2 [Dentiscutata erythropus]|uniref:16415_t:CDS:1 n=1 Tax=Dentiscutata erythropus TaxID=1348616 RepID=A0A9N9N6U8_9GLOM|nr:16415_t:CDS:2 [Dentiscutata erythropus]